MLKKLNEKFDINVIKPLVIMAFILYILILCWMVFFKGIGIFSTRQIIFEDIDQSYLMNISQRFAIQFRYNHFTAYDILHNSIPNIVVFIPLGLFLPIIYKDKFGINLLIAFGMTLIIEIFQLVFPLGGFEFWDMFTNIMGFILGYMLFKVFKKKLTCRVINYICLFIIIIALPFCIYDYVEIGLNFDLFKDCFSIENFNHLFN